MKRREFIGIAAASAVLSATARDREPMPMVVLATPHLLDVLRDQRLVCELGERYCEITPGERTVDVLEHAILADLDPTMAATTPLEARVNDRVRHDFTAGRTVALNGWILSVTEARQCALYSLLAF